MLFRHASTSERTARVVRHGRARFNQELIGRPIADKIYKDILGDGISIIRGADPDLDQKLGVDAVLILGNGLRLLGQEKFLSHEYAKFRSLTVEHYQNPDTQEKGDWFTLACQFYFVGYLTEDEAGFSLWLMANWLNMVIATTRGEIVWHDNKNKDGRARASFKYTIMDDLPDSCVIAHKLY